MCEWAAGRVVYRQLKWVMGHEKTICQWTDGRKAAVGMMSIICNGI